ncbi:MAG: ATP-binding protein [Acidimicrobiales bacterium]
MSHDRRDGDGRRDGQALRLAGVTSSVAEARRFIGACADELRLDDERRQSIELVVSELATNAVQAAPDHDFEIRARHDAPDLIVTVVNRALEVDIPDRVDWRADNALARRGRGLGIVDLLADSVDVHTTAENVTVTVTFGLD